MKANKLFLIFILAYGFQSYGAEVQTPIDNLPPTLDSQSPTVSSQNNDDKEDFSDARRLINKNTGGSSIVLKDDVDRKPASFDPASDKDKMEEFINVRDYQANSGVHFDAYDFKTEKSPDPNVRVVIISASLAVPDVSVLYKDKYIISKDTEDKTKFNILVDIPKDTNKKLVHLTIVDTQGTIKTENFLISYSNEEIEAAKRAQKEKKFTLSVSLGETSVSYTEGNTSYNSVTTTGKIGATYNLTDEWTLKASSYLSLFPVTKNDPDFMRFFGVNAVVGYNFASSTSWHFSIFGGGFFETSMVPNNDFGFYDLSGPELVLSLKKNLTKDRSLVFYVKGATLNNSTSFTTIANHEIAGGASFLFPMLDHQFSVNLDASQMKLPFLENNLELDTVSLSLGINF